MIGSRDPNKSVEGGGIKRLQSNGCNVTYGILEKECDYLNKRFFTYHKQKRPCVILKWAESNDGFISPIKSKREVYWISGDKSRVLSHRWRSEEHSILVGVQTIIDDDPILTTRHVDGKNPIRIVLDPNCRIPINSKVFSEDSKTIVLSKTENKSIEKNSRIVNYDKMEFILRSLYDLKLQSVIIEGGSKTIQNFLDSDAWDSIRIFKSHKKLQNGIKSPEVDISKFQKTKIGNDTLYVIER